MREVYLRLCDWLADTSRFAIQVLMVVMTVDVLVGVFFRYVVGDALSWTEETARYTMIWMGFFGAGLALREGSHAAVELLLDSLPMGAHRVMVTVIRVLSLLFLLTVVGAGVVLVGRVSSQTTPVLGISMMWPYLAVPIGCLLTALEMVALMLRDPQGQRLHVGPARPVAREPGG